MLAKQEWRTQALMVISWVPEHKLQAGVGALLLSVAFVWLFDLWDHPWVVRIATILVGQPPSVVVDVSLWNSSGLASTELREAAFARDVQAGAGAVVGVVRNPALGVEAARDMARALGDLVITNASAFLDLVPPRERVNRAPRALPSVTTDDLRALKVKVDALLRDARLAAPLQLLGDCPLSVWVLLGWRFLRRGAKVRVGPTSYTPPGQEPVVVQYPIAAPLAGPAPFESTVEECPGGDPSNVLVFVRRLRTDKPSGAGLAAIVSEINPGRILYISLRDGESNIANSEGMTAWCSSVEQCVVKGLEGLPSVVKACGVVVAAPVHVAYATGRGLAAVSSGRMSGRVVSFDETSRTGSRDDATYAVAFEL